MLHLRCGRGSRWSYGELNIQPHRTTKGQRQGEENSWHTFYLYILPTEPETHMFAMVTLMLNPSAHCPLSSFIQERNYLKIDFCFLEVRHEETQVPELNNKATWKATETVCLVIIALFFFKELQVHFRRLEGWRYINQNSVRQEQIMAFYWLGLGIKYYLSRLGHIYSLTTLSIHPSIHFQPLIRVLVAAWSPSLGSFVMAW